MDSIENQGAGFRVRHVLTSLGIAFFSIAILYLCFTPIWETNDDVGMSMVAHGYGMASTGMPTLIFSNVMWGYVVRALPTFGNIPGYSVATLAVLLGVTATVIFLLHGTRAGFAAALSVCALMLLRPVLFPQFTVNAGLLILAALISCHFYACSQNIASLVTACVFAFLSFLIRDQEFILALVIAAPLVHWRAVFRSRNTRVVILIFICAMISAWFANRAVYQEPSWTSFSQFNTARAPVTDFGVAPLLKAHPEVLQAHGFSTNDIDLVESWFFVDPRIADAKLLKSMIATLGNYPKGIATLSSGWESLQALTDIKILPLVLAALLLFMLSPTWRLALSWAIFIAAIFAMGIMGRPGVLRVYYPLVCLLLLGALLSLPVSGLRRKICTCILCATAVTNMAIVFPESANAAALSAQTRLALAGFSEGPTVVWGASFPYESAYPFLGVSSSEKSRKLFALGAFTLAPFSVAYSENRAGRGFPQRLLSSHGVDLVSSSSYDVALKTYCHEHFHGSLEKSEARYFGDIVVNGYRCQRDGEKVNEDEKTFVQKFWKKI